MIMEYNIIGVIWIISILILQAVGEPTNYEIFELIDDGSQKVNNIKLSYELGFNISLGATLFTVGTVTNHVAEDDEILPERTDFGEILPKKGECGPFSERKILGGNRTELDEFPWLVLLYYEDKDKIHFTFECGGTLISKRYVLTAAHCLVDITDNSMKKLKYVRLGEYNITSEEDCKYDGFEKVCLKSPPINIEIEEKIVHENYEPLSPNQQNDIGLLRLVRDVEYTDYIRPICLPLREEEREKNYHGLNLTVAGWGVTENNKTSDVKLKVLITVQSNEVCRSIHSEYSGVSESQMCAGGEGNKGACLSDSGGPLMAINDIDNGPSWYVVGIISHGPRHCEEKWPTVFIKVSKYIGWILRHMRL